MSDFFNTNKYFIITKKISNEYSDLINTGNDLYDSGNFKEAIDFHNQAIGLDPSNSDAYYYKANALHSMSRFSEAILNYDIAIHFDPTDYETYTNKGTSLNGLDRHQEALRQFQLAIFINPEYPLAIFRMANTLTTLNKFNMVKSFLRDLFYYYNLI